MRLVMLATAALALAGMAEAFDPRNDVRGSGTLEAAGHGPGDTAAAPIKVIYIAGWGRSGSTILDGILGQVPGLVSVGEIKFLWERGYLQNRRCSCGEPFRSFPFWTEVMTLALPAITRDQVMALDRASRRTRTRHLPPMLLRGSLARYAPDLDWYRTALAKLYRAVLQAGDGDIVVDSSKYPSYAFMLKQTSRLRPSCDPPCPRPESGCLFVDTRQDRSRRARW